MTFKDVPFLYESDMPDADGDIFKASDLKRFAKESPKLVLFDVGNDERHPIGVMDKIRCEFAPLPPLSDIERKSRYMLIGDIKCDRNIKLYYPCIAGIKDEKGKIKLTHVFISIEPNKQREVKKIGMACRGIEV